MKLRKRREMQERRARKNRKRMIRAYMRSVGVFGSYTGQQLWAAEMQVNEVGRMMGIDQSWGRGQRVNAIANQIGFLFPGGSRGADRLIFLGEHIKIRNLTNPVLLEKEREKNRSRIVPVPVKHRAESFYHTPEWRRIRMAALVKFAGRCMACGLSAKDGVRIVVDHIKPVRTHWNLRLDETNVQILCNDCNLGKGSTYTTDWRNEAAQGPEEGNQDGR